MNPYLYIFLDEAGNFEFSPSGTKWFSITSVTMRRPFGGYHEVVDLRYDLIEQGFDIEYFHASEDRQIVRQKVFETIRPVLRNFRIDSVLVEKRKCHPLVQQQSRFYPEMFEHLLKYIVRGYAVEELDGVIVFTDTLPVKRKRRASEKAVKTRLASLLPIDTNYALYYHRSASSIGLHIADYCNWATYRKWA